MKNRKPQILLLGNGINRAFNSDSWDQLLNSMAEEYGVENAKEYICPETLKAILVTRDRVDEALSRKRTVSAISARKSLRNRWSF